MTSEKPPQCENCKRLQGIINENNALIANLQQQLLLKASSSGVVAEEEERKSPPCVVVAENPSKPRFYSMKRVQNEMGQFSDPAYATEFTVVNQLAYDVVEVTDCHGNNWVVKLQGDYMKPPTLWFNAGLLQLTTEWSPALSAVKWLIAHIAMMQLPTCD